MSSTRPADADIFTTTFLRSGGNDRVAAFQATTDDLDEPYRLSEYGGTETTEEVAPPLIIPTRASG